MNIKELDKIIYEYYNIKPLAKYVFVKFILHIFKYHLFISEKFFDLDTITADSTMDWIFEKAVRETVTKDDLRKCFDFLLREPLSTPFPVRILTGGLCRIINHLCKNQTQSLFDCKKMYTFGLACDQHKYNCQSGFKSQTYNSYCGTDKRVLNNNCWCPEHLAHKIHPKYLTKFYRTTYL